MVISSDPPAGTALELGEEGKALPHDSWLTNDATATEGDTDGSKPAPPLQLPAQDTTSAAPAVAQGTPPTAPPQKTGKADKAARDDGVSPIDFDGSVDSNNELPSAATLRKIENYVVLDRDGKSHPFKSLYTGRHVARRVLIIFVRHFFCGNCQEYLRALSASITPTTLLQLPVSTSVAVIGCGDPGLIDMYASATGTAFPVYADPERRLYADLGMVRTLALGSRPAYMRGKSLLRSSLESVAQGLRQIRTGLVGRAGDQRQIGGEFLFEPAAGLLTSPPEGGEVGETCPVEEKRVTWCHRMKTTRDHAEVPELMEVLGLDSPDDGQGGVPPPEGPAGEDARRWSKVLEERKGTGVSMAGQMAALKAEAGVVAPAPAAL